MLVTEPGYLALVDAIRPDVPSISHVVVIGGSGGDIGYEDLLMRGSPEEPANRPGEDELAWLEARVTLGMHHEQQHQELILTDIKSVLASSLSLPHACA